MNKTFTVEDKHGRTEWNLNSKALKVIKPLAKEFGMSVEKFLYLHTLQRLPGQLPRGAAMSRLMTDLAPAGFAVTLPDDPEIQKRIRRAAKFDGRTVKDYVWNCLSTSVDCLEDELLLSPRTGRPIAECIDLHGFIAKERQGPGYEVES
jgi:hypothetical protein